jgi:hypothetical protein
VLVNRQFEQPGRFALSRERGRVRVAVVATDILDTNPSPPAFARLRRGRQSSPLQEGERLEKACQVLTDKKGTLPNKEIETS